MSKQPKWQRARILTANAGNLRGEVIWVEASPPHLTRGIVVGSDEIIAPEQCLNIAYIGDGQQMVVGADEVELLPEFADDVPLIPWEQFLAECRASKESR